MLYEVITLPGMVTTVAESAVGEALFVEPNDPVFSRDTLADFNSYNFV